MKINLLIDLPSDLILRQSSEDIDDVYVNQKDGVFDVVVFYSKGGVEEFSGSTKKAVLITGEPSGIYFYNQRYLKQFDFIYTCQKRILNIFPNSAQSITYQPWWVGRLNDPIRSILSIPEIKYLAGERNRLNEKVAIFSSTKGFTRGHFQRRLLAESLKRRDPQRYTIYGKGYTQFDDKAEVLKKYKYVVSIENSLEDFYITEKFTDPILAGCYMFYIGSKQSYELVPEGTFSGFPSILNVDDLHDNISRAIDQKVWEDSQTKLESVSNKIINEINLISFIRELCEPELPLKKVVILPEKRFIGFEKLLLFLKRKYYILYDSLYFSSKSKKT